MKRSNKILCLVITGMLLYVTTLFLPAVAFGASKKAKPIRVGAIISLTGAASTHVEVRDSLLLAAEEINAGGGINGRRIELIIEDSKTDPDEGVKAFNRIEEKYAPDFYISTLSSVSLALLPLAEKHQVVLVALVTAASEITKNTEWVFRYWTTAESETVPVMSMLKNLGVKKLGILYLNDPFGISVFSKLKEEFEKTGGEVQSVSFEKNDTVFSPQIRKLAGNEAIYTVGLVEHTKNAIQQLRKEGYNGHILCISGSIHPMVTAQPESQGVLLPAPMIFNPNYVYARDLRDAYEKRYGRQLTAQSAVGYDLLRMLASLMEGKPIDRKQIRQELDRGFIYSGVFGEINLRPGEHDITFPLHPVEIAEGGGIRYLFESGGQ
ncbi:MAG: ABC transporter substrate-binding protein [Spirochaetes bacterium]|nr:ABC transporter substrate-binding protein [Spirochaetota bacterium]